MGFSVRLDDLLPYYCEKSYNKYYVEGESLPKKFCKDTNYIDIRTIKAWAIEKTIKELEQGIQAIEYKFNTLASSRGDFIFVSISLGLDTSFWGKEVSKAILRTRMNGQGKKGFKKPVVFPKLIFLYTKELHGVGKPLEEVFNLSIECSMKAMYPDYTSLDAGYIGDIYKKYKEPVTFMGCVQRDEIVTYKYKGNLYIEGIGRMWDRLSSKFTILESADGDYCNLQDISIYDSSSKGFVECTRINKNRNKNDWKEVTFTNGRVLTLTDDHPLVLNNTRTLIKDAKIGDEIVLIPSQYSEESIPMPIKKAWLLGVLLCDGCYKGQYSATFAATKEDDIIETFQESSSKFFNLNTIVKLWERGKKGTYKEVKAKVQGTTITKDLNNLFGGYTKCNRQIPNEVFSYCREGKLGFLAGMIDADGHINSQHHTIVQIGSVTKELALQTLLLAQSLGIFGKVYLNHYNAKDLEKIRYRIEFPMTEELLGYIVCNKKKQLATNIKSISNTYTSKIKSIKDVDIQDYSFDVTTASDKFDVSGVLSHNCRSHISPYYPKGIISPKDEDDIPIIQGRWNIGVISLNLVLIYLQAKKDNKEFFDLLNYYLELVRQHHIKTYNMLCKKKASTNPIMFTQGGLYGGNLNPDDTIESIVKHATMSFGYTGLNELNVAYNNKTIVEDGEFPLKVLKHINNEVERFKKEDMKLYSVYGTPAESLGVLQVKQIKELFGDIKNITDIPALSNSFHCGSWEDITPIQKQDLEERFWEYSTGGRIQYCRYNYKNIDAVKTLVRRAMEKGFYEGVNMALSYCENCGHEQFDMQECPKCKSTNITKIERLCGLILSPL